MLNQKKRLPITLDPRRTFTPMQKAKLFMRSKGRCDICKEKVKGTWIAGHYSIPHALGGPTTLENGRVECRQCARQTHAEDTTTVAKTKRMEKKFKEGRGRKRKGEKLKSRGFDRRWKRKLNGKAELRDE
ncbi:MAG: HNH endonuclease [Pseudomonadota bacterium]